MPAPRNRHIVISTWRFRGKCTTQVKFKPKTFIHGPLTLRVQKIRKKITQIISLGTNGLMKVSKWYFLGSKSSVFAYFNFWFFKTRLKNSRPVSFSIKLCWINIYWHVHWYDETMIFCYQILKKKSKRSAILNSLWKY